MDNEQTLEQIPNEHFKENIEASRYILSGAPEIAMHIMSKFSLEHITLIKTNCKLLLTKSSRMSGDQILCLRSKIVIIDLLIADKNKK